MIEECINIISEKGPVVFRTGENEILFISEREYRGYILTFLSESEKVIKESYLIKDKETLIKILDGILNEFERGRVIESLKKLLEMERLYNKNIISLNIRRE